MFKKVTQETVHEAVETVKGDVKSTLERYIPIAFNLLLVGIAVVSATNARKAPVTPKVNVTIHLHK